MYEIKFPITIYDQLNIADGDGHLCTCEGPAYALLVASALRFAATHPDFNPEAEVKNVLFDDGTLTFKGER